jgi:hypothetical protein
MRRLELFKISFLLLFICACSNSPVQEAAILGHIKKSDSLEKKIDKTLALLNEHRYFQPKQRQTRLSPPFDNPYHLDSLRTADEILSQKVGGSCGSTALSFAAILNESGVDEKDIQLVAAVLNPDLKAICPQAGQPRAEHPDTGARGHVFVALRFSDGKWKIINTTDGSVRYGRADWLDPEALKEKMKQQPVEIPHEAFQSLPYKTYEPGLTAFQTWSLQEFPKHNFEQRFDLIASGRANLDNSAQDSSVRRCRFTAPTNTASRH